MAIGEEGEQRMTYRTSLPRDTEPKDALGASLQRQRATDIRRGMTHSGPHRDDLHLTLNDRDLRAFGSAGQQRTAAIALRMLEAATLRSECGLQPLLLLDDPFAELDLRRSARILALLGTEGLGQTILAVPRESDIPPELLSLDRALIHAGAVARTGP